MYRECMVDNPNADILHRVTCKIARSYRAICKIATSYPASCKIVNTCLTICKIAVTYRAIGNSSVLLCNFLSCNLSGTSFLSCNLKDNSLLVHELQGTNNVARFVRKQSHIAASVAHFQGILPSSNLQDSSLFSCILQKNNFQIRLWHECSSTFVVYFHNAFL